MEKKSCYKQHINGIAYDLRYNMCLIYEKRQSGEAYYVLFWKKIVRINMDLVRIVSGLRQKVVFLIAEDKYESESTCITIIRVYVFGLPFSVVLERYFRFEISLLSILCMLIARMEMGTSRVSGDSDIIT